MQYQAFDNLAYKFVCKNKLFDKVDSDFFKNQFVKKLFELTKKFYKDYKDIPFDIENPAIDQIRNLVDEDINLAIVDPNLSKEENARSFLVNAEQIINTDLSKYNSDFIKKAAEAWIAWQNHQKGYKVAMEWERTQEVTPENVFSIIQKSKEIFIKKSSIILDDDLGKNILDPEAHKQIPPGELYNSGYQFMNTWLSDNPNGGFEPGTFTLMIGESNIGKSIWLGNLAKNLWLNGNNVALASVEMSEAKIYKRIGSSIFNVPIKEYNDFSNDGLKLDQHIRNFKEQRGINDFTNPIGQLWTKRFASATPDAIVAWVLKLEQVLGIKIHAVVIDYLTELNNSYGLMAFENSYQHHKLNVNDLYNAGIANKWATISAHQIKIDGFGADDITLKMMGESSGIIHRLDNCWGIIQTPEMKLGRKYFLKNLKSRDGGYKNYYNEYEVNYDFMTLTEKQMLDPTAFLLPN